MLEKLFKGNQDPIFQRVISDPGQYRLQVIYTKIDRDKNNKPRFTDYYFNYDPEMYFNPASMVKMPLAFLSLEKLNQMSQAGVNKYTTAVFDSDQTWQQPLLADTTALTGLPSIAHFIKRAFIISENDPYNRMYQFVGQGPVNRRLHEMGYKDVRITRQFLGLTPEQNRHTNAIRFLDEKGEVLFHQPPAYNTDSFDFSKKILIGVAHMNSKDSLVNAPFDFTKHNNLSLGSMHDMLRSVMLPASVSKAKRFDLSPNDYEFLYRYMSQYPSETPDPRYDTTKFYDSYVKFFFRNEDKKMPEGLRVFNKVGWSYGFLTDVSYVADFKNGIEYMLSATLYVNSDQILNDGKYEYKTIGYPFLYQLGQTIYQYELQRPRKYKPDLSAFRVEYEKRDDSDGRSPLKEVDN